MPVEHRIAVGVAVFLLLALASWGLVGSVLYVWHSETLQRSAQSQADLLRQQAVQLQQYEAALRQLQAQRGSTPEAAR